MSGPDRFDVPLEDREFLEELELTTRLIIAANDSTDPLSPVQVDGILTQPAGEDAGG